MEHVGIFFCAAIEVLQEKHGETIDKSSQSEAMVGELMLIVTNRWINQSC